MKAYHVVAPAAESITTPTDAVASNAEVAEIETVSPAPRVPFTDVTWELIGTLFTGQSLVWPELVDLEHELAPRVPHLSHEEVVLLVDFCRSGLPVVLTWEWSIGNGRIMVQTATVLITSLRPPDPAWPTRPGKIGVRYTGFAHDVHLVNITRVEQTPVSTSHRSAVQS